VELLVVIALIGILIALLLPAVQAAREAARRMQCANNVKQIGVAMHNYHDAHRCFPPGNVVTGMPVVMSGWSVPARTNWAISLLPYLEYENLYDQYDHNVPNRHPANKSVRETQVPVYSCPSDIRATDIETPQYGLSGPSVSPDTKYRCGSYRGMAGRSDIIYILMPDRGFWGYPGFQPIHSAHPEWKGVFHVVGPAILTKCEGFSTTSDGASNTIAVGECHGVTDDLPRGGTYWAYSVAYSTSQALPLSRSLRTTPTRSGCAASVPNVKFCDFGWGSYHPDGINWLMCDGSVHFLSTNVDMNLFCDLATVAGGEVATVP